jgi:hypothetical protein
MKVVQWLCFRAPLMELEFVAQNHMTKLVTQSNLRLSRLCYYLFWKQHCVLNTTYPHHASIIERRPSRYFAGGNMVQRYGIVMFGGRCCKVRIPGGFRGLFVFWWGGHGIMRKRTPSQSIETWCWHQVEWDHVKAWSFDRVVTSPTHPTIPSWSTGRITLKVWEKPVGVGLQDKPSKSRWAQATLLT